MPIFSKTILASAVASMCLSAAVGGHIGFCAGKSLGIYSVPGEPACTTKYYQCNHGPDATLGECGADTRFWLRGGEGSWYYMCDHPDRVPACSAAVIDTFCDGKAAGSYARGEGDNTCTDKYWECDGSSDAATEMTCPADQVFDGSSCVGIETVMACPAITRGCAGVTTASDVPIADGNACSYEYYQCTGTSPVATKATCPDGQAFSGGMCMDRSMVADCVVTAGFCTANPSGMDFPDLSVPLALGAIDCSPNYLSCDGTNADPTVMSCGANEVPKFTRTGAGAFSVSCVAADSVCSVCAGPPGPPTQNPNNCREGLLCVSNQVNIIDCADIPSPVPLAWSDATGSCALIETVMTCPAITRACAGVTAMSKIVNPNAPACTVDYYQCDGTSPIATEESCATDEAFDVSTGTCVARASVSACAAVSPLGYCTGRGYAGVFPNPNQSDNKCSSSYWTCNWTGATDAIERSCPAGRVVHYNAAAPTWNFWCGPAPADC